MSKRFFMCLKCGAMVTKAELLEHRKNGCPEKVLEAELEAEVEAELEAEVEKPKRKRRTKAEIEADAKA